MKRILIPAIVLTLLFTGCMGSGPPLKKTNYYTLEYDPPIIEKQLVLPVVIQVNRFSIAQIYNSNKIIYSEGEYKRDAYQYHKWRANPADLVTYFLTRDLKESGVFKAVLSHNGSFRASHTLEGSVDEFYQKEGKNNWEAVLTISITLMKKNEPDITKSILLQKQYTISKTCEKKNPQSLARAMSEAMASISSLINSDVYSTLNSVE